MHTSAAAPARNLDPTATPVAVVRRTATIAVLALVATLLYLVPVAEQAGATAVRAGPATRSSPVTSS
ncbi:MAG: hypothetical protein S0880_04780 [Actinomycetota bacterium]|nr:hypothetical protein [Actinomycetota bacterium]